MNSSAVCNRLFSQNLVATRLFTTCFANLQNISTEKYFESNTWDHQPAVPNRRVVRMFPVKNRHRPRIVLLREGCTNRPFYTIQVKSNLSETKDRGIEQVGSWDPYPNKDHNEQLIALNLDRICYWIAQGAEPSTRVKQLLGLAGLLPVHPRTYLAAHRARLAIAKRREEEAMQEQASTEHSIEEPSPSEEPKDKFKPASIWRRSKVAARWLFGLPS